MFAEQFIDRLEQQGLLDERVVAELRRRVAKVRGKKVTPEAIAKFLVDKGHLTRFQATKLVSEVTSVSEQATSKEPAAEKSPDELDFVPEKKDHRAPVTKKKPEQKEKPGRAADQEVEDLLLFEDEDAAGPQRSAAAPSREKPASRPTRSERREAKKSADAPRSAATPTQPVAERPPSPPPAAPPTAPPPPVPQAETPGTDLLDDDLATDLEASGQLRPGQERKSALAGLADLFASGGGGGAPAGPRRLQSTSEWDSMVLLGGGALLGVLIVLGGFLYFSLTRGAAEDLFAAANTAYGDEAYSQAIKLFDRYLRTYPNHEKASLARVRRGMARLRQSYKDPEKGLKVANEVLPRIEKEEDFPEARDELASMLPQIARGFIDAAKLADDAEKQEQLVDLTSQAMKLVNNPVYIPPTARKSQAVTIQLIEDDIARVQREIDRDRNLADTVETINNAVASGDTKLAYRARSDLLKTYPGLDTNEQLYEAVLKISEKEREQVRVVDEAVKPVTDDRPLAGESRVVLAHQTGQAIPGVRGYVAFVLAGGSLFGLDVSTGDVLWRRFIGFEATTQPTPVSRTTAGADAIAVDRSQQSVMRLAASTGKLVWRLPVGEPFAEPVVIGEKIYIACQSGKLLIANADTGDVARHVLIPQPLEVGPAGAVTKPHFYQVGDQDNLYVLSADTLECKEVFYIGHRRGTIVVPPVMALGYLFVLENAGPDFSRLHIIRTDQDGLHLKTAQRTMRLEGQVLVPPVVGRRRVLVVTDRRAVELYDVDPSAETKTPVTSAARQSATSDPPTTSYSMMERGYMWIANDRFTKYQVQASTGKLPSEWVRDEQDVYVAPLQLIRDAIIHVRRKRGTPGFTVAATRVNDKESTWQTELAVPIRKVLVRDDNVEAVTARGRLFEVSKESLLDSGVLGHARASALRDERLTVSITQPIPVAANKWAFTQQQGYNQVVLYEPGGKNGDIRVLTLTVPLGDATIEPEPFAGGLLVPLRDGKVALADLTSGGQRAHPLQPEIAAGQTSQWSRPAVLDGGQEFVIGDNHQRLYRVGLKKKPEAHLAELGSVEVRGDLLGSLAAVGKVVYGTSRSGAADVVMCFTLPNLEMAKEWPLEGRVLWGPQRIGDAVMIGTREELICFDEKQQQRWKVPLEHGPVVGRPLVDGGQLLFSSNDGFVWRLDAQSGKTVAVVDVGEPLDSGPIAYGEKLLVPGKSGVLFVVANPRS